MLDQLLHQSHDSGSRIAITHKQAGHHVDMVTYDDLAARAAKFAGFLSAEAPEAPIIPLYLSKSADCVAAALGTLAAGRMFAVLNRKLRLPQIERVIRDTASPLLVVDGAALVTLRGAQLDGTAMSAVHWVVLRQEPLSSLQQRALDGLKKQVRITVLCLSETEPRSETIGELGNAGHRPGCCLFTSGSTGSPKGVLIDSADLVARADAEIRCFKLSQRDVLLSILPFSFDVGLNQMLSALRVGASLVLLDSWLSADILNAVGQHGVTGISSVPSIWRDLINQDSTFDMAGRHRSLRYLTVSGGSLGSSHLARLAQAAPGVGIFKTYGQTEAFRATCLLPEELDRHPDSVGRPFEGVKVYILGEDAKPCASGVTGQVLHSGLGIMLGYLGGASTEKLVPNPFYGPDDSSEMAVLTGDFGYLNEGGFLFLRGRKDSMLKVAGNRVYPDEVLEELLAVEGIAEAEVFGLCDQSNETHLIAFMTARDGATVDSASVRKQLVGRLPSYMLPETIITLSAMPRTLHGKVDRVALINDAMARHPAFKLPISESSDGFSANNNHPPEARQ